MFERIYRVEEFDEALQSGTDPAAKQTRRRAPFVVGDADDSAERAADAVADRGMETLMRSRSVATSAPTSSSQTRIRRSIDAASSATIGRAGGEVSDTMTSDLDAALGKGRPFEPTVQRAVRSATGQDVSDVRIHTDGRADQMANDIQASAFTVDRNIFFAAGQYRPGTADGMHRVLHESGHLPEGDGRVRRSTIRRLISVTTTELDGSFKHRKGLSGLRDSVGGSEILKIRDGLKSYHAAKSKKADKKLLSALESLTKHSSAWLAKNPRGSDRAARARIDLIDSINIQASLELTRNQAASIYMGDASAKANKAPAAGGAPPADGPGSHPLQHLMHPNAFRSDSTIYDDRTSNAATTAGGKASTERNKLVASGELGAADPATTKAMHEALEALSPAEFAALHTYTGADYRYINPNVGGWGIGDFGGTKDGKTDPENKAGKANRQKYEEAGLHAGFMAEAFRKLPIWKGTTYRGMTAESDFLGLTKASSYMPKEFWSTSEARSVAKSFLNISAVTAKYEGKSPTMAIMCTIKVSNARDVSRLSNAPGELEIMLPPSSQLAIGKQQCLVRGKDDAAIRTYFGDGFFTAHPNITEFWLIDMTQRFSGDEDVVGAYPQMMIPAGGMPALPKKPGS